MITTAQFKSLPLGLKFIILLFLLNPFLGLWIFSDSGLSWILYAASILIITIFSLAVAYFLYERKNWMRLTVIVLAIIEIAFLVFYGAAMVSSLIFLQMGFWNFGLFILPLSLIVLPIAINIFFIWYFLRKRIKALFFIKT